MIKKIIKYLLLIGIFLLLTKPVMAEDKVNLHFFWASGCPHCEKEKIFLDNLKEKYPQLVVNDYEVTQNSNNLELLKKVGEKLQIDISGVPFTVVGEDHFAGYLNDETTGAAIEDEINCSIKNKCEDVVSGLVSGDNKKESGQKVVIPENLKLPIFGEIKSKNFSLPLLTFVIALVDGFNPCAMWTLLFLISLLLGMKNKKRMWVLGVSFILASGFVYFLFLSAWLNLFLFLGFVVWVRILIGILALGTGGYYLRDYWVNRSGACPVSEGEKRQKIFTKIRSIVEKRSFILAILGIILLAFAVNLVELICSAGLPAIYTKILSLSNLPIWQYYLYLLFYIFIFMLDDLVVFFIAMFTLQVVGMQSKYARFSHLIGGILILTIGILLLLKSEWLMFG